MVNNAYQACLGDDDTYPQWIGGGILPKGCTLLAGGETKTGKTWLNLELGDALTVGPGRFLFQDERYPVLEKARVLVIDGELGSYGFKKRLRMRYRANGKPGPADLLYVPKGTYQPFKVDQSTGWYFIRDLVKQTKADVVIIDPASYFISTGTNEAIREFNTNLGRIQTEVNPDLSFVVIHHFNKPMRGSEAEIDDKLSVYRFRDGSNWPGDADSILTMHKTKTNAPGVRWNIHMRLTLRHDESPDDFKVCVNRDWSLTRCESSHQRVRDIIDAIG